MLSHQKQSVPIPSQMTIIISLHNSSDSSALEPAYFKAEMFKCIFTEKPLFDV